MAYIPITSKCNILPACYESGHEVFSYSSELEDKIGLKGNYKGYHFRNSCIRKFFAYNLLLLLRDEYGMQN